MQKKNIYQSIPVKNHQSSLTPNISTIDTIPSLRHTCRRHFTAKASPPHGLWHTNTILQPFIMAFDAITH